MSDPYYFGWEAIGARLGLSESRVRRYKDTLLSFVERLHPPASEEFDADGNSTRRRKVRASRESSLDNCAGSLTALVSSAHSIGGNASAAKAQTNTPSSSPGAGSNATSITEAIVAKD